MRPLARVLAGVLLVVSVLAGSLALTAGPAAACTCVGLTADGPGLTYDQWRTGRLVLGVLGLVFLAFFVLRAFRARRALRRGPGA